MGSLPEKEERWAGGWVGASCEKQKDNGGVIFEDQPATELLWELPVQTMRTLSLNLDL